MSRRRSYLPPAVNYREVCRYAASKEDEELFGQINECYQAIEKKLCYRVCFEEYPLFIKDSSLDLTFARCVSLDLSRRLAGCKRVVVFAATVGAQCDKMIIKHQRIAPGTALLYSALGSERVESLCDLFEDELKREYEKEGYSLTARFSPGYGDLSLDLQKDIFEALAPQRSIGLTLNDSLIMSPCKSVSGLIGVKKL